ncbi:MAG: DUF3800 domain-containing protein [Planctomycetes bacterium]|nr:DUF3800 domain-containing protein [Planctomycetota bacterium]
MSYLLFIDESGHDHRSAPYEVHGGIALHASKLWPFIKAMQELEQAAFGGLLHQYGTEIKGAKLLNKERFRWASQDHMLDDEARRKHSLAFLNRTVQGRIPSRIEFTAYGQASLLMARGIFDLLNSHGAVLFASVIPGVIKPSTFEANEFLRKDQVFLMERYFYFLEAKREPGLLVMDETDKVQDRNFVRRMEMYFKQTQTGRYRTSWIVPVPFFVSSDMTCAVQAADVCIYCVNWGFRLPPLGMDAPVRPEIQQEFGRLLGNLQFEGDGYKDGKVYHTRGIIYVPDPYTAR